MSENYLYVGSWLDESGKVGGGIRVYKLTNKGAPKLVEHIAQNIAAGYFVISQDKKYLYAVNEIKRYPDVVETGAEIYAYSINQDTGSLKELNHISSCGVNPNYIVLSSDGKYLYGVNYGSEDMVVRSKQNENGEYILENVFEESSMFAIDVKQDGSLGKVEAMHTCSGEPSRYFEWFQSAPHPHCIGIDPSDKMLLVADRGCEKIITCHYDINRKTFTDIHEYGTAYGFGPRNCVFHPSLPYVYIVGEVKPYVTVYKYDAVTAELQEMSSYLTSEKKLEYMKNEGDFFACAHPSDIRIHPNGQMIYIANRGPDTIACFSIDQTSGKLELIKSVSAKGRFPWSMDFSRNGKWMYVGNKSDNCICCFELDAQGNPQFMECIKGVERTTCLKVVEI